jgi:hypothetical protein
MCHQICQNINDGCLILMTHSLGHRSTASKMPITIYGSKLSFGALLALALPRSTRRWNRLSSATRGAGFRVPGEIGYKLSSNGISGWLFSGVGIGIGLGLEVGGQVLMGFWPDTALSVAPPRRAASLLGPPQVEVLRTAWGLPPTVRCSVLMLGLKQI